VDWLRSGARFDDACFAALTSAIAEGVLSAVPDARGASRGHR
jgi:hypothetical protein